MPSRRLAYLGAPLGLALGAAAAPSIAAAQVVPVVGPYVSLGVGADFLQNEQFKPSNGVFPAPRAYRFDVGPAGNLAVGFGLGNGFRVEVEGDYAYNHVRGVTYSQALRAGGYQQQYGGFGNVYYDIPMSFGLPISPYLGAGVGYRELELDGIQSTLPGHAGPPGPYDRNGSFAYQGIAGMAVPMGFPGLSLTAEYRFIGMTSPSAYYRGFSDTYGPLYAKVSNTFNHEALIGIRFAFGAPPPPPPPAPAAPQEAAPAPAPSRTYLVFFDWDRADLTARARQIIGDAAQASTHVQTTRIEVNGYTDLSGTAKYNMGLSIRRADAVAAELVRDGVSRSEIFTQGFGEEHPLVPTAQGVREPQNRRVEIILK
jgi:outer membrane protein OmpA-like peptidoglycan-associated protein